MKQLYWGVILGCVAVAQAPGPVTLDHEPRHHIEFTNESLRVVSPRIPPGDTTLEHLHTHDEVTVCIHGSPVRGKPSGGEWSNPGMACVPGRAGLTEYTGKPRSHTVQNTGTGEYRLLLVENLRDSGWTEKPALDIAGLKMLRENRSFRVYDVEGASGSHSHVSPTLVVLVSGEAMAGGKHLDQPGSWALVPAGEKHQVAAHGDAHVVEIEVR